MAATEEVSASTKSTGARAIDIFKAVDSKVWRNSQIAITSAADKENTKAPLCGTMRTRPSWRSCASASRTGVLDTPSFSAKTRSESSSPRHKAPRTISDRSRSSTVSARDGGRGIRCIPRTSCGWADDDSAAAARQSANHNLKRQLPSDISDIAWEEAVFAAELMLDCRNLHGEGVFWSQQHQLLYWTDIHGCTVWTLSPESRRSRSFAVSGRVCCLADRRGRS